MLKFISKKIALQWILLVGLFAFAIFTIIEKAHVANADGATFLFKAFAHFFQQHEYAGKGVIITVLLLQIMLLQYFFGKNEFVAKATLLPACFYISILLITKSLSTISPLFFTLMFFLMILSINYAVSPVKLKNNAFIVGIISAFATCFDVSGLIFIILAIITLIINHYSKIKEILILLSGFILVYIYAFSYYFLVNKLDIWLLSYKEIKISSMFNGEISISALSQISLMCLCIIYLYFMIRTRLISATKTVIVRKQALSLNIWSVLMGASLLLSYTTYPYILGYLSVPIVIYLTILVPEKNRGYINEWVTLITFITLCL